MNKALFALLASVVCAGAQTDDRLPRLNVFGNNNPSGKKPLLGYEGTKFDPKKAPKEEPKPRGQTEITSLEATFDQKAHQAVFIGNVVVKDPEFVVNCDRLTAFLKDNKQADKDAPAKSSATPASPSPGKKPKSGDDGGGTGGLDHAIAEAAPGREVVITQDKVEADGSITKNVGRGKKATFDSKTGNIVLSGSPSVQQGINLCIAQAEETVMTLNRNGYNRVDGPSKTVIKDNANLDGAKK